MRKLAFIPLAVLCMGAAAPQPHASANAAPAAPAANDAKSPRSGEGLPGEIVLTPPAHCADAEPRVASGQRLEPRRLDELPRGNLTLTVLREVDGCPQPATVREGYGAPAFHPEPRR